MDFLTHYVSAADDARSNESTKIKVCWVCLEMISVPLPTRIPRGRHFISEPPMCLDRALLKSLTLIERPPDKDDTTGTNLKQQQIHFHLLASQRIQLRSANSTAVKYKDSENRSFCKISMPKSYDSQIINYASEYLKKNLASIPRKSQNH